MVKNEWYVEISTRTDSMKFIYHFTTGKCSALSNVARRVDHREHLGLHRSSMMPLGFVEEIRPN